MKRLFVRSLSSFGPSGALTIYHIRDFTALTERQAPGRSAEFSNAIKALCPFCYDISYGVSVGIKGLVVALSFSTHPAVVEARLRGWSSDYLADGIR